MGGKNSAGEVNIGKNLLGGGKKTKDESEPRVFRKKGREDGKLEGMEQPHQNKRGGGGTHLGEKHKREKGESPEKKVRKTEIVSKASPTRLSLGFKI